MSYDVYADCPCCEKTAIELGNYTSNMYRFFKDFGVYPRDFDGITAPALRTLLKSGMDNILVEIRKDRAALSAKYNAPNGWGEVQSAIDWLLNMDRLLMEYMIQHPKGYEKLIIRVSA